MTIQIHQIYASLYKKVNLGIVVLSIHMRHLVSTSVISLCKNRVYELSTAKTPNTALLLALLVS